MILTHICFRFQAWLKNVRIKTCVLACLQSFHWWSQSEILAAAAARAAAQGSAACSAGSLPPFLQPSVSHPVQEQKHTIKPQENALLMWLAQ